MENAKPRLEDDERSRVWNRMVLDYLMFKAEAAFAQALEKGLRKVGKKQWNAFRGPIINTVRKLANDAASPEGWLAKRLENPSVADADAIKAFIAEAFGLEPDAIPMGWTYMFDEIAKAMEEMTEGIRGYLDWSGPTPTLDLARPTAAGMSLADASHLTEMMRTPAQPREEAQPEEPTPEPTPEPAPEPTPEPTPTEQVAEQPVAEEQPVEQPQEPAQPKSEWEERDDLDADLEEPFNAEETEGAWRPRESGAPGMENANGEVAYDWKEENGLLVAEEDGETISGGQENFQDEADEALGNITESLPAVEGNVVYLQTNSLEGGKVPGKLVVFGESAQTIAGALDTANVTYRDNFDSIDEKIDEGKETRDGDAYDESHYKVTISGKKNVQAAIQALVGDNGDYGAVVLQDEGGSIRILLNPNSVDMESVTTLAQAQAANEQLKQGIEERNRQAIAAWEARTGLKYDPEWQEHTVHPDGPFREKEGSYIREGARRNGEIDGEVREYRDGVLRKTAIYKNGSETGTRKLYRGDGTLALDRFFNEDGNAVEIHYGKDGKTEEYRLVLGKRKVLFDSRKQQEQKQEAPAETVAKVRIVEMEAPPKKVRDGLRSNDAWRRAHNLEALPKDAVVLVQFGDFVSTYEEDTDALQDIPGVSHTTRFGKKIAGATVGRRQEIVDALVGQGRTVAVVPNTLDRAEIHAPAAPVQAAQPATEAKGSWEDKPMEAIVQDIRTIRATLRADHTSPLLEPGTVRQKDGTDRTVVYTGGNDGRWTEVRYTRNGEPVGESLEFQRLHNDKTASRLDDFLTLTGTTRYDDNGNPVESLGYDPDGRIHRRERFRSWLGEDGDWHVESVDAFVVDEDGIFVYRKGKPTELLPLDALNETRGQAGNTALSVGDRADGEQQMPFVSFDPTTENRDSVITYLGDRMGHEATSQCLKYDDGKQLVGRIDSMTAVRHTANFPGGERSLREAHNFAAKNILQLVQRSVLGYSYDDRKDDVPPTHSTYVDRWMRIFTPFVYKGDVYTAMITLRNYANKGYKGIYDVEELEVYRGPIIPGHAEEQYFNLPKPTWGSRPLTADRIAQTVVSEKSEDLDTHPRMLEGSGVETFDPEAIVSKLREEAAKISKVPGNTALSVGSRPGRAPEVRPGGDVREAGEGALAWLRRKFVHSQTPVFDAVRRVMGVGREPPDALNVEAAAKNVHGKIRARQEMLQRAYLEPLKAILAQPGMDRKRFDDYALALHALERNRMIQERSVVVDPTTGEVVDLGVEAGSGVTNAWAERVIREIQRDPFAEQYKEAANILAEMNRFVLRGAVADGLLTEAQAKTWMRLSPHYVPLILSRLRACYRTQDAPGEAWKFGGLEVWLWRPVLVVLLVLFVLPRV